MNECTTEHYSVTTTRSHALCTAVVLLVILAITHSRQKEKSKLRLKLEKQIEADVEWDEGAEKGDMNLEGKWE